MDPHYDRWKKITRSSPDAEELAALRELLSPARVSPLASRVAGIPDAPEFEWLGWRKLLEEFRALLGDGVPESEKKPAE